MKIGGLGIGLLLLTASASAQVTVEVTQDQDQFLLGESMPVTVRVTNLSGQALPLGADPDWLTFSIASIEGSVVPRTDNPPVTGEFVLESSKAAVKHVDVGPYFSFSHAGHYGIVATIRIKGWGQEISSRPRYFDIIDGAKIWEQEVGVPKTTGATNSLPEVRRYILQQANFIRGQLRLYLRVTDAYGRALRVFAIGPMISFGRPDAPQVDRLSDLHVLYQNGPVSFSYTVFDPSGELLVRQTYDYVTTRPRLRPDADGNISVFGGTRRVTPNDIPPPKESTSDEPLSSGPTNSSPSRPR